MEPSPKDSEEIIPAISDEPELNVESGSISDEFYTGGQESEMLPEPSQITEYGQTIETPEESLVPYPDAEVDELSAVTEPGDGDTMHTDQIEPVDQFEHVEQFESIENVNQPEEFESVEQFERVEYVDQLEPVENVDQSEWLEHVDQIEPVEQFASIEQAEHVGQSEPIEQPDSVEQLESVEELEPVEQYQKQYEYPGVDSTAEVEVTPDKIKPQSPLRAKFAGLGQALWQHTRRLSVLAGITTAKFGKAAWVETKRSSKLISLKAQIEKLTRMDLRQGFHALGKNCYEHKIAEHVFAGQYQEVLTLLDLIAEKRQGIDPAEGAKTAAKLKAIVQDQSAKISAEALKVKLSGLFVELGKVAKSQERELMPTEHLVNIDRTRDQIEVLKVKCAELEKEDANTIQGEAPIVSRKVIRWTAYAFVALVLLMGLWLLTGIGTNEKRIAKSLSGSKELNGGLPNSDRQSESYSGSTTQMLDAKFISKVRDWQKQKGNPDLLKSRINEIDNVLHGATYNCGINVRFRVNRKLNPTDFGMESDRVDSVYDITFLDHLGNTYAFRDLDTNEVLKTAFCPLFQPPVQPGKAILITNRTVFSSPGVATMRVNLDFTMPVRMSDGSERNVPRLLESIFNPLLENHICELLFEREKLEKTLEFILAQ